MVCFNYLVTSSCARESHKGCWIASSVHGSFSGHFQYISVCVFVYKYSNKALLPHDVEVRRSYDRSWSCINRIKFRGNRFKKSWVNAKSESRSTDFFSSLTRAPMIGPAISVRISFFTCQFSVNWVQPIDDLSLFLVHSFRYQGHTAEVAQPYLKMPPFDNSSRFGTFFTHAQSALTSCSQH